MATKNINICKRYVDDDFFKNEVGGSLYIPVGGGGGSTGSFLPLTGGVLTGVLTGVTSCMTCCHMSPIVCATTTSYTPVANASTCSSTPLACATTCSVTPLACATTCHKSPTVCATTLSTAPTVYGSTLVCGATVCGATCSSTPIAYVSSCICLPDNAVLCFGDSAKGMVISSDGSYLNIAKGSATTAMPFYINNTVGTTYIYSAAIFMGNTTGTIVCYRGNCLAANCWNMSTLGAATVKSLSSAGEVTSYASDERLKTCICNIEDPYCKIEKINGVCFNWVDDICEKGFCPTHNKEVGLIAQELQTVFPDAVTAAPFDIADDGTSISGLNYLTTRPEKVIPLLVEAVKALIKEVQELKNKE